MSASIPVQVGASVLLLGALVATWIGVARRGVRHERAVIKAHARAQRAHYAAIEAAESVPDFSPEEIESFVSGVIRLAGSVWRSEEGRALEGSRDARIIRAWAQSQERWLGRELSVVGPPSIDILGVVNREDESEDRVVVRVRMRVRSKHPKDRFIGVPSMPLDERWTLGRRQGHWRLLEMDGDPLAGPLLIAPLIPNRSFDNERLTEESLAELAATRQLTEGVPLSELVSPEEPPSVALPDLAFLDGRFDPGLIASELAHLIEAWQEAVTGTAAPLEERATSHAIERLLRPRRGQRLVVRDAVLMSWTPTKLDLSRVPPAIEVSLKVSAVRFVVTTRGAYRAGNQNEPREMDLRWTLERTDSQTVPWELARSNNPAEGIGGWVLT